MGHKVLSGQKKIELDKKSVVSTVISIIVCCKESHVVQHYAENMQVISLFYGKYSNLQIVKTCLTLRDYVEDYLMAEFYGVCKLQLKQM